MLIYDMSRLKRSVVVASRTSYPPFLILLTDSEVLLSIFLPQLFLRCDGTSIVRPPIRFSFVRFDAIVSIIVSFTWLCNLSWIPFDLNDVCP